MIIKIKLEKILEILIVFSIILDLNSVYAVILRMHSPIRISFFCIFFLLLLMAIKKTKIKIKLNTFFFLLIYLSGLIIINTFLNFSGLKTIIIYYLSIFLLFYFYFSTFGKSAIISMINTFIKIVVILSLISLFFWFTADCLKIIKPTNYSYIDFGTQNKKPRKINSYFYLHFDTQKINNFLTRNSGIFSEAPMFAIIILMALMFQMFESKIKHSKFNIYILFFTIFTTITTTGIICSLLLFFFYIIAKEKKYLIFKQLKYFIIPVIALIFTILFYNVMEEKFSTLSYSNRILDYKNAFNVFIQNPILGKGINHDHFHEWNKYGYGYSNSISKIITDGGIYLLSFFLVAILKAIRYGMIYKNNNIIFMSIMCVIFSIFIIFVHNILSIFLLAISYSLRKENT